MDTCRGDDWQKEKQGPMEDEEEAEDQRSFLLQTADSAAAAH